MRATRGWACGLLLLCAAAQAAELEVTRVEDTVLVRHADGSNAALAARQSVVAGDAIATGANGRLSLRLAGGGSLMLGGSAALQLDGSEPPDPPGRATLARLRLGLGALHVDARKGEQNPPADIRLNLRHLQARLYGTDAWAQSSSAGDELCVLSGAAEIDTPGGHQRLDAPGECLRWTQAGAHKLSAAEAGSLLPRLAATSFSDDYATRYAAEQAQRDGSARPTLAEAHAAPLAPVAAAPPAASAPADAIRPVEVLPRKAVATPAAASEWRIALGAFINRANADRSAEQWLQRKLKTDIELIDLNGRTAYRLLCGHYTNRAEAEQALANLRKLPGYESARVLSVPDAASRR